MLYYHCNRVLNQVVHGTTCEGLQCEHYYEVHLRVYSIKVWMPNDFDE